ncbi:sugar ABC transporter substrate-binding protein [Longirhabdus pacifica]|uniref:sugar ABC transporter substrate-binding protein n=1 Tax=Longirhabdus pacifica TaxID=2305227 RepID=UPI00100925A6|nr:extracellular solute-binding protein [Longirhabdus pacifica]
MKLKSMLILLLAMTMVFTIAACGDSEETEEAGSNNTQEETVDTTDNNEEDSNTEEEPMEESMDEEIVPEEGAEIIVWDSANQKEFIEERIDAFETMYADYNVDVTYETVEADTSAAQVIQDAEAGLAGDVFIAAHDNVGKLVNSGVIAPIYFDEETKAVAYETAINAVSYKYEDLNLVWGYPSSVETIGMFYNKDLIAEAPETWEEVVAFANEFNDDNNNYGIMWEAGNAYYSYGFFAGYGAYVFGDNGTNADDIGMNSEGALEAATFVKSLKSILPIDSQDIQGNIKDGLFEEGKLAMNITGPWMSGAFKEKVPNLAVAPLPKLPNGEMMKPFSGTKAYFVNAFSEYPDTAQLLAQFLTSEESQLARFENSGDMPANEMLGGNDMIKNDPLVSGFLQQYANSEPMPSIAEMGNYWSVMESALAELWNNAADEKETMDNMVQQLKDANATMN